MGRAWAADLHVHTCLSPCASLDMTPRKIVARARAQGLAMIAVTDHNSAENAAPLMRAAQDSGLCVLPGMEVTTAEEAHVVAIFGDLAAAQSLQELVYSRLQRGENDEDLFGMQVVANEHDEVEGFNPRLLLGATELGIEELVAAVHERRGLAIAAHIDREAYSLVAQLGFIPADLALDAVEISGALDLAGARARFPEYRGRVFVTASDAHELDDLGSRRVWIEAAEPSFAELCAALRGEGGRRVLEGRP
ncbi:MAG: PHP domain-containing protein [Candidatus Eisenbacteria bacterium]